MPVLLIPLFLFLLYQLERWVFQKYWERKLEVELNFEKEAVIEGQEASLKEVITNRNFIPLHILQVSFQTDTGLDFADTTNVSISDRVNVTDVFSLRFYSRITRHLTMNCVKRGYYSILQTSVTASDFFSPDIHYALRKQRTSLYVYPRMLTCEQFELLFLQLSGEVLSKRFLYEDIFTFRGIREYAPTDPMSSINWKATARTGEPKVNIHDYTARAEVVIILNVEEPGILFETELIEDSMRIALSLADRFIKKGVPVSLLSNGRDKVTGDVVRLSQGASADHLSSFSRALARIDLTGECADICELTSEALEKNDSEQSTYCMISTSKRDKAVLTAERICDKKGKLMWICPLTRDMDSEPPKDGRIDFNIFIHE